MQYYIFRLNWSQTDQEIVIIEARSLHRAKLEISNGFPTCFNIDYLGHSEHNIIRSNI